MKKARQAMRAAFKTAKPPRGSIRSGFALSPIRAGKLQNGGVRVVETSNEEANFPCASHRGGMPGSTSKA
jgi:hypothetical protein